jgi:Flp pilus assembly protein TadD
MQAEAVTSTLDRVLASAAFRRAARLRRFIEYVVREELAGKGEQIREYSVGVSVFQRNADYNPQIDTIVRVEAIKLRERLSVYFDGEGATEPIRISLPKGSYRPHFQVRDERPESILDDPDALYWQLRSLFLSFTPAHYRRAIRLALKGVRRWPQSARMHALLAEVAAGATCSDIGFIAPSKGLPLMQSAAQRALELDPDCATAHLFAHLSDLRLADKSQVIAGARRALALAPENPNLHHWAAVVLMSDGRLGEALLHARQAARLEPNVLVHRTRVAMMLFLAGRMDAAAGHLRDILAFEPHDLAANLCLNRALDRLGRHEDAIGPARRAYAVSSEPRALLALGYSQIRIGNLEAADEIVCTLRKDAATRYVPASGLALMNIAHGRFDLARSDVAMARRQGDFSLSWTKIDPRWEPLRGRVAGL